MIPANEIAEQLILISWHAQKAADAVMSSINGGYSEHFAGINTAFQKLTDITEER